MAGNGPKKLSLGFCSGCNPFSGSGRPRGTGAPDKNHQQTGYLKAVWLEIFGPVSLGFSTKSDPRGPPRSPGPAPHINLHEKSAPETKSEAVSWRTKDPGVFKDPGGVFKDPGGVFKDPGGIFKDPGGVFKDRLGF